MSLNIRYLPADKGTHYALGTIVGSVCALAAICVQAFSPFYVHEFVPALAALGGAAAAGFVWDYIIDVYVLKGPADLHDALATTYGGISVAAPLAALAGFGLLKFAH